VAEAIEADGIIAPVQTDAVKAPRLSLFAIARYGSFGMPLALVALPIYVFVPKYYSDHFAVPLALIGQVLLGVRLLDAISDPLFGSWVDRGRRARGVTWLQGYRRFIAISIPFLALGYILLFHPPASLPTGSAHAAIWLAVTLVVVYAGFSLATIAYYSWGADLSPAPSERTRISGVRECSGLIGVLAAAALPQLFGMDILSVVFVLFLAVTGSVLLLSAPHPAISPAPRAEPIFQVLRVPLTNPRFLTLLVIFLFNGIASAIPATLVLFYIRDVLGLERLSGTFLGVYFICAAGAIPLWVALARRIGEARAWLTGMVLAVAVFIWVLSLGPGAMFGFGVICVLSGAILGADLSLPPAILAGVIFRGGHRGTREGAYFGIWNLATKLNLALAAGISLPLLGLMGYDPEALDAKGAAALTLCYALVPSGLKLVAAALLWRSRFFKEAL
jgi:glycoside/pentoside/hexuronide:cation symporter, GPH family